MQDIVLETSWVLLSMIKISAQNFLKFIVKFGSKVENCWKLEGFQLIFYNNRDAGRKFQSSESLSPLIASVFILQESITAKRKLFLENDEAQAQKLNQGCIIKKIGIFHRNFNCYDKDLLVL